MTFRRKLLLAQLPLAMALAFVGITAVSNVASLGRHSDTILKQNYRSVLAAQRMKEAIERLHDLAVLSLLTAQRPAETPVNEERQRFEIELREAEANITEVGEPEALQELRKRWELYQKQFQQFTSDSAETHARTEVLAELEPDFAAVREQAQILLDMNQDAMVRKSDRAQREAAQAGTLMIVAAVAALILGTFLSGAAVRRLLQPFELLTRTVTRLSEGDFDTRVDIAGKDEVAELANNINEMATHLSQYRRSSLGELLLAQEASQAAIDSLPDPVLVFDLNGNILSSNRAAETMLDLRLDSAKPLDHLQAAVRDSLEKVRAHALSGKGAYVPRGFEEAVRIATTDGEHYLLPRATPVYSDEGAVTGAAAVLQDVTRLRRVDELRNDLVSTVAHEFRTPLTSLRMAIHLCLERAGGPLTDKQADLLYAARDDCERLHAMVDELLDLARIQSGRIELHRVAMDPGALVDAAMDTYRGLAEDQRLILEQEVPSRLPKAWVDRERIQLVLSNFLTNAIRHTPPGGHITMRALAEGDQSIRFEVADSGPGVPPEYRASIFERFVRIPDAPCGAGLGLSIAKDVVEAHGGEIGVRDTPGGGATFWFSVPIVRSLEDSPALSTVPAEK